MANMFRCTLASGGGALVLTVTCDSVFAGQTITCTDGTTTLTQICPSASPYTVEFKIPNGGTWTISSGTVSTSITIPSSVELHGIPNGSTITPTDDIQTWLHCANIWDKTYTTISQILSDASTLQALIISNNAVDYLVRSTTLANDITADSSAMTYIGLDNYCANTLLDDSTWRDAICDSSYFESVLNVKIPIMTGATTPSGVASSNRGSGWTGFRGTGGYYSTGAAANLNDYIQYKFPNPVRIFKIWNSKNPVSQADTDAVDFKASNDASSWTTIQRVALSKSTGVSVLWYNVNPVTKYQYYRWQNAGINDNAHYWQFGANAYGREDV